MKKMIHALVALMTLPAAFADYGMMDGGMMGYGGMWVYWLVWFPLAVFLFSIIFWATYKWIVKGDKKKHKR